METKDLWKGFTLEGSKDEAVFLIHGFTGTCAELYPPAEFLNKAGYTAIVFFMVGNTTKADDLKGTTDKDWINSILIACRKARTQYKKLYVLGLSMGGAIALIIDEEEKVKPDGLILYEPCLTIKNKAAYFNKILKVLVPMISFKLTPLPDNMDIYLQNPNSYYSSALESLVKISRRALKKLNKVSAPFLCFDSLTDEMITFKGIKNLLKVSPSQNKNLHIINDSEHMIQVQSHRQEVFDTTLGFLNTLKN